MSIRTLVIHPHIVRMIRIPVMIEVPTCEFVAMKKTWTKGIMSGFERIVSTSPRQKQNVTSMPKPRVPLRIAVHIIARGKTVEASLISSDI